VKQGFSKQIQREIKAHPLKAGVLALTVVVALWFWAPLIVGWVGGSRPAKNAAAAAAPAPASGVAAAGGTPATAKVTFNPNWREMVEWHSHDDLMRSVKPTLGGRDPFRPIAPPQPETQASKATAPKIDPTNLGLELTGTLIGPRQSVAMINGLAYTLPRLNMDRRQTAKMSIKQQEHQYEITLLSIQTDSVQLEFQGQQFELRVRDKSLENKTIELNEKSTVEIHTHAEVQ
jgi:hypothetical protein